MFVPTGPISYGLTHVLSGVGPIRWLPLRNDWLGDS